MSTAGYLKIFKFAVEDSMVFNLLSIFLKKLKRNFIKENKQKI